MKDIEKALQLIENTDIQVSNIEKFSYLYFYLNTLKKRIIEIEESVRKKGAELMNDEDIKTLKFKDSDIVFVEPTEIESYSASSVIESLGVERAMPFLKVDSKITAYLKKASAKGAVSMPEITGCRKGLTKKMKTGFLKIIKQKNG